MRLNCIFGVVLGKLCSNWFPDSFEGAWLKPATQAALAVEDRPFRASSLAHLTESDNS